VTRVVFVTPTMGGAGHLTLGVAIGKALERAGFSGEYRLIGPPIPYPISPVTGYVPVTISPEQSRSLSAAADSELAQRLTEFGPDLVLVDKFWSPIQNVLLALPKLEAWLLCCLAPNTWFIGPANHRFDPSHYQRRIATEPPNLHRLPEQIEPIVICNPDECHPPSALRQHLGVPEGVHLTLVAQTGMRGEAEALARREGLQGEIRVMSLHQPGGLFPLAPYLCGADRIVGGAGYALYWETRWLGLATRTLCVPQPRSVDPQALRVRSSSHVMRENGADTLARWIMAGA
jgi:hypothetical protein